MRPRALAVGLGLTLGAVAGWTLAQRYIRDHRRDLFSPRLLRRLSALAHLGTRESVETVRVLRDYIAWEPHPVLRGRAERLVRRLEATLG
jgi:hypothetical protein